MDDGRHLVLMGMMGVGKSSVGRRVALRLGRQFVDTDKLVEEEAGCTVAEIFASEGEPAFRALENAAVRRALESDPFAVIAFGGGAVLEPANVGLAHDRVGIVGNGMYVLTLTMLLGRILPIGVLWWVLKHADETDVAIG